MLVVDSSSHKCYQSPILHISMSQVRPRLSNSWSTPHTIRVAHLAHDDGAVNGQLQVLQGSPHNGDHTLHPVNFLTQEDIHGGQCTHLLEPCLYLRVSVGMGREENAVLSARTSGG